MTLYATNVFIADGTRTIYDFAFAGVTPGIQSGTVPYLYPEDVKALEIYIDPNGNLASIERAVAITAPNRATILGSPVAGGRTVKIYRQTEIRFPLVDYQDRQTVSELDLDLANRQAIFVAQEVADLAATSMAQDRLGNHDAEGSRIVNLAPGVDPADATNLGQVEAINAASAVRSLRVPEPETSIATLPAVTQRANKILSFDSLGNPQTLAPASGSATGLAIDLADTANPSLGAAMVGRSVQAVRTIAELRGLSKLSPSATAFVSDLSSVYVLDTDAGPVVDNGGSVIVAADGGVWMLRQITPVSVAQFGAVGDGVTDDTAAIQATLDAHLDVILPPHREFKITQTLRFRSGHRVLGELSSVIHYAAVAPAVDTPVLAMVNIQDAHVSGFTLKVDPTLYPTARCLYTSGSTDCEYANIELIGAGGSASYTQASTRCVVRDVEADVYMRNGFYVNGGKFNRIDGCRAPNGSAGFMGAQIVGGFANVVCNGYFANIPDNYFGIHSYGCDAADLYGNVIENTRREALAVGGRCTGVRVHDNTYRWTTNLGIGDFGMSLAGDDAANIVTDFQVYGNTIIGSALDGIGVAGWTSRGIVHGNIIRDCCQMGSSGHQSGIKLYGWITGAVVDHIDVYGNTISKVSGGSMLYGVTEIHGSGIASNNTIRDNTSVGLSGSGFSIYSVEAASSVVSLNHDDLRGKVHNAVPTSLSGALTAATGVIHFQTVGKFVHCTCFINIINNGSGAGNIRISLPFQAVGGSLSGETSAGGKAIKTGIAAGGSGLVITNYDSTYPAASGALLSLSGILRIA